MKVFLRLLDIPGLLLFPEARELPPNYFRCRVGVSGRLAGNEIMYLTKGANLWFYLLAAGHVNLDSNIIEIGCGCGRRTHWLRDFNFHGTRYSGRYVGIDVDREMLDWCRENFPKHFEFHQSTHATSAYGNDAVRSGYYRLPADDGSTDLVFATSVLTHLLEDELRNYFAESFRVLRDGKAMVMTCKCLDREPNLRGRTYSHRIGNAYVDQPEVPEAAVAYREEFLLQACRDAGFGSASVHSEPGDLQQTLIASK